MSKQIDITLAKLTAEYDFQCANTVAPGNPYVSGLNGRIGGIKEALKDPHVSKCVNLHEGLVEIIQEFMSHFEKLETLLPVYQKAKAIVAKAESE